MSEDAPVSKAPLETPSANGVYLGTVPVRVVPQAQSGRDLKIEWGSHAANGRQQQSRRRLSGVALEAIRRTVCRNGHPMSGANVTVDCRGLRVCKACKAARERARVEKRRKERGTKWR